jgi:hypothetical protein
LDKKYNSVHTREKILLKDIGFENEEEVLEMYYGDGEEEIGRLGEYYKYYVNNPILFFGGVFRVLYRYY